MRKSRKRISRRRVSRKRVSRKRVSRKRVSRKRVSRKRVSRKRVTRRHIKYGADSTNCRPPGVYALAAEVEAAKVAAELEAAELAQLAALEAEIALAAWGLPPSDAHSNYQN